ncbi:MAG: DASS family sodium-coupled anion symporter [Bacteroidetes bacterium]|nr:MAG: DASS family sodium-coupled anion symporter [Bacteroidota bacterium]
MSELIETSSFSLAKLRIIAIGPILFFILILSPQIPYISPLAQKSLAVAIWMLAWWISESVEISVTALLPLILFPLLGILSIKEASQAYGNPVIFLFMGGFMLALALEKHKLHLRIALNIVKWTGTNANGIIWGFMLATAFLSMWISNTATTVMMLPIATSVIALLAVTTDKNSKNFQNFAVAMMLGIGYAATIGGVATLIGTPPNTVMASILAQKYNYRINFGQWMAFGFPFMVILLYFCFIVLTKIVYPNRLKDFTGSKEIINTELTKLGNISTAEIRTLIIFSCTAFLWIFQDLIKYWLEIFLDFKLNIEDTIIAVMASVALFLVSDGKKTQTDFLLVWKDTEKLPWGILLLFGGGLCLADALDKTGLIQLIGNTMAQNKGLSLLVLLIILAFLSVFISEIMSNVALVSVFVPVVLGLAVKLGENPLLLSIAVTLGASCAFMLPMGSPPNAIIFSSGYLKVSQMVKAGFILNIISIILIVIFAYFILPLIFGTKFLIGN